ncbi:hypothetical protein CKO27_04950 [Thiocystis violacea]|nr:hypothetical protein [Thiocystis violacea]
MNRVHFQPGLSVTASHEPFGAKTPGEAARVAVADWAVRDRRQGSRDQPAGHGLNRRRAWWWLALCGLLGLVLAGPASAGRILVLVHGYLGDSATWRQSGALAVLEQAGWKVAGNWRSTPYGVWLEPSANPPGEFAIHTVDLPSTAPLMEQARLLGGMLGAIAQGHPTDSVDLIGHSAGGVVARLALVNYGAGRVTRLITIAAPHLGTERATQALEATDDRGLFGGVKRWLVERQVGEDIYHTVQSSRGALVDLAPPMPGNLLYWLNARQHPDIHYVAVIRGGGYGMPGDQAVPAASQDLRRVFALNQRADIRVVPGDHLLSRQDGLLLSELVSKPAEAAASK